MKKFLPHRFSILVLKPKLFSYPYERWKAVQYVCLALMLCTQKRLIRIWEVSFFCDKPLFCESFIWDGIDEIEKTYFKGFNVSFCRFADVQFSVLLICEL